jgi:hypothetical protein
MSRMSRDVFLLGVPPSRSRPAHIIPGIFELTAGMAVGGIFIRYHIDETDAKVFTRCSSGSDQEKLPNSALIIRRFPEQGTSQTPVDDRRCLHFGDVYIFNHPRSAKGCLQEYLSGQHSPTPSGPSGNVTLSNCELYRSNYKVRMSSIKAITEERDRVWPVKSDRLPGAVKRKSDGEERDLTPAFSSRRIPRAYTYPQWD